jgi:hypothetical protein
LRSTFASHLRHGVAYTVIDVDVGTRNLPGFLGALSINWTVKNIVDRMCQPVCVKRGKVAPIANYLTVGTVRKVIKSKHERFVQCPLLGAKRTWLPDRKMSAYDPKRTWTWFVTAIATAGPSAKINHTQSNFQTARRFSLFIFIIIAFQPTRERILPARKRFDETPSHWRSVCDLDRLLPLAAARARANVHLTGLLLQNYSHYTDWTKASAIQARACGESRKKLRLRRNQQLASLETNPGLWKKKQTPGP